MTEEIEQIEEDKTELLKAQLLLNRNKKKRSNSACQCEDGPTREPLHLAGMIGEKCGVCMEVLNWRKEGEEVKTVKKPKEPKAPAKEPKKESKAPEQVAPAIMKVSVNDSYPVIKVLAIRNKPDHMEFLCVNGEKMFAVEVPSTVEKVNAALLNPLLIVGKHAMINHEGIDPVTNFPINPKVTKVITPQPK